MAATAPTAEQVEALLAASPTGPARVVSLERLGPWSVLRCRLAPSGSVIVKWLRDDPRGLRVDPRQVATERAALEFLAALDFPYAPRLIAADPAGGLIALEDASPRTALDDQLRAQGAADLTRQRLAFAHAIGALNAATAGKSEAYDAARARYGPPDPAVGRERGLGAEWPQARRELEALGLAMSADVERELAEVVETLAHPGPFLALSNGDPEPNNFLVDGDDGRLIDFEFAGYRHALTCARWIHVPGPAWITLADPIAAALEAEYRRALAAAVPEAEDDRLFGAGMAAACLAMACDRLGRFALLDARAPGERSRLQMVGTLEAAAAAARRHRALPHLTGWVARAAAWLRRRWPDADIDLAALPPYAPR